MEQTKEEILSNCLKLINVNDKILKEEWGMELKAMGEYAQQVAIAFAEWAAEKGWEKHIEENTWFNRMGYATEYTTTQLFDLFIKEYQK